MLICKSKKLVVLARCSMFHFRFPKLFVFILNSSHVLFKDSSQIQKMLLVGSRLCCFWGSIWLFSWYPDVKLEKRWAAGAPIAIPCSWT